MPELTEEQTRLVIVADNWRGIASHEGAALALARDLRVADPEVAGFILSTLGNTHGRLGLFCQASLRLGAGSTVVLSACNSGRGEILAEGVVGLARAFLFAVAAATVVSLWSVDDGSKAALMKQMYKHLEDGRTTAQALQLAMLHLLFHGSRWSRPLYWAAFLMVGANAPPREEEDLRRIVG